MRLKTFTARTMKEAMAQVRADLGPDAIIVSSRKRDASGLVRITAAVDNDVAFPARDEHTSPADAPDDEGSPYSINDILSLHYPGEGLLHRLSRTAGAMDTIDPALALAGAVDSAFRFLPLEQNPSRPWLFAGLPGTGKTVAMAKVAARAVLQGTSVALITTDTVRAGGIDQLAAYARLLNLNITAAPDRRSLANAVAQAELQGYDMILIDTPGLNPFDSDEVQALADSVATVDGEVIGVAAAGIDRDEACDLADLLSGLGSRRFIATRLDTARRFGGLLAIADRGPLAFAGAGTSPYIGDTIEPLNPVSLARLLAATPKSPVHGRSGRHQKMHPDELQPEIRKVVTS